jgi:acyl carrier protein
LSDVEDQVLAFFATRDANLGSLHDEKLACEYLDQGVLDSMGIVAMVLEFEQQFGISFGPEEMQSVDFRTVGGLVTLIERLRA